MGGAGVIVVAAGAGGAADVCCADEEGREVAGEAAVGVDGATAAGRGDDGAVAPPTSVRCDEP
jgi:hypothetical protein